MKELDAMDLPVGRTPREKGRINNTIAITTGFAKFRCLNSYTKPGKFHYNNYWFISISTLSCRDAGRRAPIDSGRNRECRTHGSFQRVDIARVLEQPITELVSVVSQPAYVLLNG